jgi:hypothetical protein
VIRKARTSWRPRRRTRWGTRAFRKARPARPCDPGAETAQVVNPAVITTPIPRRRIDHLQGPPPRITPLPPDTRRIRMFTPRTPRTPAPTHPRTHAPTHPRTPRTRRSPAVSPPPPPPPPSPAVRSSLIPGSPSSPNSVPPRPISVQPERSGAGAPRPRSEARGGPLALGGANRPLAVPVASDRAIDARGHRQRSGRLPGAGASGRLTRAVIANCPPGHAAVHDRAVGVRRWGPGPFGAESTRTARYNQSLFFLRFLRLLRARRVTLFRSLHRIGE